MVNPFIEILISIGIFIHLFFVLGQLKSDNSVMTFAWPLGILIIGIVAYLRIPDATRDTLEYVLIGLVTIWGVRLFLHTLIRNIRRGYEDFRYNEFREGTDSGFLILSYIKFYLVQGIFMLIVAVPLYLVFTRSGSMGVIGWIGSGISMLGILLESTADYQLTKFKSKQGKYEVLTSGLWSISRHPNYLGEILFWWGVGLISLEVTNGWIGLISPIIVTLLLRYVSGVPLLEQRYDDNEAYQQYRTEVPPIFPRIEFPS